MDPEEPDTAQCNYDESLSVHEKRRMGLALGQHYSHDDVLTVIRNLKVTKCRQMRESARCFARIALTNAPFNEAMKIKESEYLDRDTSLPQGVSGFPVELRYVLVAVDAKERTKFRTVFEDDPPLQALRLVGRDDFNKHVKRFSVGEKWSDISFKLDVGVASGLKKSKPCEYETIYDYARNFLAMMDWVIRTDHLPDKLCFSKNNYGVGRTDSFHYLYPRQEGKIGFKKFEEFMFENISTYCEGKGLRNFNGNENTSTHNLNLGYAKNLATMIMEDEEKADNQKTQPKRIETDADLVVGLADFCSQCSLERLRSSTNPYTISPQIQGDYMGSDRQAQGMAVLGKNISLKWDSNVLFPIFTRKFDTVKSFKNVYLDYIVSPEEESWRNEHMHEFYEHLLEYLRLSNLITDTSAVFIPFCETTVAALHRSYQVVKMYADVKFIKRNVHNWGDNVANNTIAGRDCRSIMQVNPVQTIVTQLRTEIGRVRSYKANKKVVQHSTEYYQRSVRDLKEAVSMWQTRDEDELKQIDWIKLSIRSDKKKKNSEVSISYPKRKVVTKPVVEVTEALQLHTKFKSMSEFRDWAKPIMTAGRPIKTELIFNNKCDAVEIVDVGLLVFPQGFLKGSPELVKDCGMENDVLEKLTSPFKDVCEAAAFTPHGCFSPKGKKKLARYSKNSAARMLIVTVNFLNLAKKNLIRILIKLLRMPSPVAARMEKPTRMPERMEKISATAQKAVKPPTTSARIVIVPSILFPHHFSQFSSSRSICRRRCPYVK